MKAQFKYAFLAGSSLRYTAFALIVSLELALGIITLTIAPWLGLRIVAVSLGGVAISVMLAMNIVGDIAIIRRMYGAPSGYLHALTPAPRWQILLASVLSMAVIDIVTMSVVIALEAWLSMLLGGLGDQTLIAVLQLADFATVLDALRGVALIVCGYLLSVMLILFTVTLRRSLLYQVPAGRFLAFLIGCAIFYAYSLLQVVFIPFGVVERIGWLITVTVSGWMIPLYILYALLGVTGLFVLTAQLMERKLNI